MDGGWQQLLSALQQIFERTAYQMTMGWICVKATWHRMIRFRQSEDIYIQRQLSPRLGKRGGQLSSSTSIHYVSIKKSNGDRRTHRHPNCHTGKPRRGSEVHLLLNNQETLRDFFAKSLSGGSNLPDVLFVTVCTLWAFKLYLIMRLVFDLSSKRQVLLMDTSRSVKYRNDEMGLDVWQFWQQDKHLTETNC